jgi:hypothetical protein
MDEADTKLVELEERILGEAREGHYRISVQARMGQKRFQRAVRSTFHAEERNLARESARRAALEPVCEALRFYPAELEIRIPRECAEHIRGWLSDQANQCILADEDQATLWFSAAFQYEQAVSEIMDALREAAKLPEPVNAVTR